MLKFKNFFHKHDFHEVNREIMDCDWYRHGLFITKTPITVITYKCSKCPKHKQITLDGTIDGNCTG